MLRLITNIPGRRQDDVVFVLVAVVPTAEVVVVVNSESMKDVANKGGIH